MNRSDAPRADANSRAASAIKPLAEFRISLKILFHVTRLKTGDTGALDRDSMIGARPTPQWGDEKFMPFSFRSPKNSLYRKSRVF